MNYTENYQLPQWEKSDRIMMEDFNDAFQKVDTATRILVGSYTGNGKSGEDNPRSLSFTFTPMLVIITARSAFSCGRSIKEIYRPL